MHLKMRLGLDRSKDTRYSCMGIVGVTGHLTAKRNVLHSKWSFAIARDYSLQLDLRAAVP